MMMTDYDDGPALCPTCGGTGWVACEITDTAICERYCAADCPEPGRPRCPECDGARWIGCRDGIWVAAAPWWTYFEEQVDGD